MAVRRIHLHEQIIPFHSDSWGRRRQAALEDIPLDVLHLIADHSCLEDFLCLRTVSKSLQKTLSDRSIWRALFARSTLFLPPGPYRWQPASYLIDTLSRVCRSYSVWPSFFDRPEFTRTCHLSAGPEASFSILFGRWLFVAEESMLGCYDTYSSDIAKSGKALFDAGMDRRILRLFTVGHTREDGIVAFAVLVFEDKFTIARVVMDWGSPIDVEPIFTSPLITGEGWTGLVSVRLYHRLLVVNVGDHSSDWGSSGSLVIMDVDTLSRYRIPASTDDSNMIRTVTHFYSNKTHFIKITSSVVQGSKIECFPIPIPVARMKHEVKVLHCSHLKQVNFDLAMRQCSVIYDSPAGPETAKISFTLCGLVDTCTPLNYRYASALGILEVCLVPDGSISLTRYRIVEDILKSICIEPGRNHICGIGLMKDNKPFLFALNYRWPRHIQLKWSAVACYHGSGYPESEVVALDAFRGTAFFACSAPGRQNINMVRMVDFTHGTRRNWS